MQHPCYGCGIYTSTKHALKGLVECLWFELFPFNIRVTICCPGFAKTPLLPEGHSNLLAKTPLLPEGSLTLYVIHAISFSFFFMCPNKASLCSLLRNIKYTESDYKTLQTF